MNCAEANQVDMVEYLVLLGYEPRKIRNADHWYLSPLRDEKEASFKVNIHKNVWYDHGLGKGGTLVDFAREFYHCSTSQALEKIASFHGQKQLIYISKKATDTQGKNESNHGMECEDGGIVITSARQPITDFSLCRYAKRRNIDTRVLNEHCHEVSFKLNDKDYRAIGFKNNAGGYELRNEYFKAGSTPKFVSYRDNHTPGISVFEGFFDLLSYHAIHKGQEQGATNYLVLNSLSFFERSLLLMEKHDTIKLYLDNDTAGRKWTETALKRSPKFQDESKLYKGYKDLNEWLTGFGKHQHKRQSVRKGL